MMDWIFDHPQVVILVLLGVGSMVKSILDSKSQQKRQQEEDEYDPGEVFAPDEEYSKPRESNVPPPLNRQSTPPPLRESGYEEAAAIENAKALKHQHDLAERLRHIRETKATTTGGAAATQQRTAPKSVSVGSTPAISSIRERLRNPSELRKAIVMREILDTPLGLR